ncbi:MAG: hypothetical protein AAGJ32_03135 [Pseudomonadota bacterium]
MSGLYISHRQGDRPETAMAIAANLRAIFDAYPCFIDTDRELAKRVEGECFDARVARHLITATAMAVIIGPNWLAADANGRSRLWREDDYVRIELETALKRGIAILPVLVGGTSAVPAAEDVPDSVRQALQGDAIRVQTDKFAMGAHAIADHFKTVLSGTIGTPTPDILLDPALGFTPITLQDGSCLGAFEALRLQSLFEQVRQSLSQRQGEGKSGCRDRIYGDALIPVIDDKRFQMAPHIAPSLERASRLACKLKPYQPIVAAVDLSFLRRGRPGLLLSETGLFHFEDRAPAQFFSNAELSRGPIESAGDHYLRIGARVIPVPSHIDMDRTQGFVEAAAKIANNAAIRALDTPTGLATA